MRVFGPKQDCINQNLGVVSHSLVLSIIYDGELDFNRAHQDIMHNNIVINAFPNQISVPEEHLNGSSFHHFCR
jgi:hypothetical protein